MDRDNRVIGLPLDVARCAGRPNGLGPEDPICPRRDTCLRYRHILEMGPSTPIYAAMCEGRNEFPFYLADTVSGSSPEEALQKSILDASPRGLPLARRDTRRDGA